MNYKIEIIENIEKNPKRQFFVVSSKMLTRLEYYYRFIGGFTRFNVDVHRETRENRTLLPVIKHFLSEIYS